jgi:AraC-like DNA-binding protein
MTNMTFREYVISRRIEFAQRLLLDPLNNISSVSDACGFSTPAYFARVFRKVVGCAPTEYANDPRRRAIQPGRPMDASHETHCPRA